MKKLTTVSITVLSIVTLLFIAQPAQARGGAGHISVVARGGNTYITATIREGFDLDECLKGAVTEVFDVGTGSHMGFLGRLVKIVVKGARFAGPIGTAIGTSIDVITGCLKQGIVPDKPQIPHVNSVCTVNIFSHRPGHSCYKR
ncbi:hypothetical protein [Tropheryma whipplei]|uniref:hypothetical protein n=1 Tax=Tropheryma whipplei TaxID=2039 RepID=UPI0004AEE647|nr:hypothetical protein [Tropheryma whipplei]